MLCKSCQNDMLIKRNSYEVTGDNSPDTKTVVSSRLCFFCVNKNCTEYGKEVMGEPVKLF